VVAAAVDELLGINVALPLTSAADAGWKACARLVERLPYVRVFAEVCKQLQTQQNILVTVWT